MQSSLRTSSGFQYLLVGVLCAALGACGGGGGGGSATATTSDKGDVAPTVLAPQGTIYVSGGQIFAVNGKKLILRGINLQYGDSPGARLAAIDEIARTGANAIRLQLRSTTTAAQLQSALDAIVAKGLAAVLMYWEDDVTCKSGTAGFATAMTRWTDTWKSVLSDTKYRPWIILNIANEWGVVDGADTYGNTYRAAIRQLRATGYQFPLMVDAPDCGQNYGAFASGGAAKIAVADVYANTIFSVHAYWSYQTASAIDLASSAVRASGYPLVWGEFGQAAFQASSGHATNHAYLMKSANDAGVGYLAWSWYGNGGEAVILDMSTDGSAGSLTAYGQEIINGTTYAGVAVGGIRATTRAVGL